MLAPQLIPSALTRSVPVILQFPTEASRPVRSLRNMTTQLLQEAAQVIPNQQLLINVVSKRVRQLGLGHRPLVETTPRMSLTDIALKEIIAGKLAYQSQSASRLSHSRPLRSGHRIERQRSQIHPRRQSKHQRRFRANRKRRSFP